MGKLLEYFHEVMQSITKEKQERLRKFQRKWMQDRKLYSAQSEVHFYTGTLSSIDVLQSYLRWTLVRSKQLFDLFGVKQYAKRQGRDYLVVFD